MKRIGTVALFALAALTVSGYGAAETFKLVEPGGEVNGKSSIEFAEEWWKWMQSTPDAQNPADDDTGKNCAVGQQGDVWFLAGSFGHDLRKRSCEIPAGKYIFFPVVNKVAFNRKGGSLSCSEAKRQAALSPGMSADLFVEIDGVSVPDVERFRAKSKKCFNFMERRPAALGTYDATPTATDGYWIMIEPLPEGQHSIRFGGGHSGKSDSSKDLLQNISYAVTIK